MNNPPTIQVYVKGTPRPQPRPRLVNGHVVSTASKPAKAYKATVLAACRAARATHGQIKGPVSLRLDLWFYGMKHAKEFGHPHTFRPDGDNVLKLWQDAAQAAGLIQDDSQVWRTYVEKRWAATAGALMVIRAGGDPLTTQEDDDDLGALTDPSDVV